MQEIAPQANRPVRTERQGEQKSRECNGEPTSHSRGHLKTHHCQHGLLRTLKNQWFQRLPDVSSGISGQEWAWLLPNLLPTPPMKVQFTLATPHHRSHFLPASLRRSGRRKGHRRVTLSQSTVIHRGTRCSSRLISASGASFIRGIFAQLLLARPLHSSASRKDKGHRV